MDDLPYPSPSPLTGLSARRLVGMNGIRLSAVLDEQVIGYVEVEVFEDGSGSPGTAGGPTWATSTSPGLPATRRVRDGDLAGTGKTAFNRSTLLTDSDQPDGDNPANYCTNAITNHCARIAHATTIDRRGYAFTYVVVAPAGGADQSGAVSDPAPALLTVTLDPVH